MMNSSDSEDECSRQQTISQSPSTCTYCYTLQCAVQITSTTAQCSTIQTKNSIVTVGRTADRKIVLQIELTVQTKGVPAVISYPLRDCKVHTTGVASGRGGIEIPSKHLSIHFSNCAPRKINVFLKTIQAKLEIMTAHSGGQATPLSVTKQRLLYGGLPNVFEKLSPLTVKEIREVRKLRGVTSPLSRPAPASPSSQTTPTRKRPFMGRNKRTQELCLSTSCDFFTLSEEQRRVVRAVVTEKKSVFFTGSAGTGKSLILRRIIEMLPAESTAVTAATGVAACQLGGVTLHSFAGIGLGTVRKDTCLKMAEAKPMAVKRWRNVQHLIIDEISMIDGEYFNCIEFVARKLRATSPDKERPFGGIQLIITGDFLQLPPVVPTGQTPKFCFESAAWRHAIQSTILLTEVRRQNDEQFVRILQQIRIGRCPSWATAALCASHRRELPANLVPTILCTHTAEADAINKFQLEKLETSLKTFAAEDSEPILEVSAGLVPKILQLKVNAQVMLTKNIDLHRGLSNGARGVIVEFSKAGFPVVQFAANNVSIELRPLQFQMRSMTQTEGPAIRRQLPLQLAWAISIHKSQGLTLDAVDVNLGRVFAEGQAYVALSRARSLEALKVNGFAPECVRANEKVIDYYDSLCRSVQFDKEETQNIPPKLQRHSL